MGIKFQIYHQYIKYKQGFLLGLIVLISFLSFSIVSVKAGQITVGTMPIGTVVSFGGIRWIKIDSGNTFMAVERISVPITPVYMQDMTEEYCSQMRILDTLYLIDSRDGKGYGIKKFADGNCWMIDNLKYGGDTDVIAGKTTFSGNGQATPYTAWYSGGAQLYGDARDPSVGTNSDYCATGAGTGKCGYLYNWQAAMQQSLAYYGPDYTGLASNSGSGVCPFPWQLPSGSSAGQFYALHTTYGSPTSPNFWANTSYWNGVYAGLCDSSGTLGSQGDRAYYWSSTQYNTYNAYSLDFYTTEIVYPQYSNYKYYGFSVRCVL